jgi:serine protease Do
VDIAILQFSASETPSVSDLGNSDDIRIGDKVFTIGTPTGQENTVSEGNISFTNRELNGRRFLQFTAPISPGSSGGGLFDEDGNIIGITTASLHSTSGPQAGFE